jgi:peroxiredoxin Q/BCP
MAREPGDAAPDFTLADQRGNPVKLSDLWAQTVVLYFYPKAEAGACETRLHWASPRSAPAG